jgi:hypothetical protein
VLAVASATSSAVSADTAQVTAHYRRQIGILAARIEYLKAKYTRENTFRNALARQKKYLYLCLGGYSVK